MPDGPVSLWGCAFDYYGNVIVTDIAKGALRKFDKDLRYIVAFGTARTAISNSMSPGASPSTANSARYWWPKKTAYVMERHGCGRFESQQKDGCRL